MTLSAQVWDTLEHAGVPGMIRSLRNRLKTDRTTEEARSSDESATKPSVEAISEAAKYEKVDSRPSDSALLAADRKVRQDAENLAKQGEKDPDEVYEELITQTKSEPYVVLYESLPGAPFYRAQYYGGQLQLFINTEHRFYSGLYSAPDVSDRTRGALDLLLFALGYSENQAAEELVEFYKRERQEWSKRLDTYLIEFNRIDPIETDSDD